MSRRFPPPWTVEKIPGGFKVVDANHQSLAYVYSRETQSDAQIAKVLTEVGRGASLAISIRHEKPPSSPEEVQPT